MPSVSGGISRTCARNHPSFSGGWWMASAPRDGMVPTSMRVMGLDVGTKTIGVAVCDELGITAQGLPTVRRVGPKKDVEALKKIVAEREVERIVVGLPLNLDGSEGHR